VSESSTSPFSSRCHSGILLRSRTRARSESRTRTRPAQSSPSVSSTSYPYSPCTQEASMRPIKNPANMTALGYLVGPTIGSLLYSATHPSLARGSPSPLEVMDKAFYDHIKANRASPAFQSVNNPAPDFYGEKVCHSSSSHHIKFHFT
jgi:hypothetical protein